MTIIPTRITLAIGTALAGIALLSACGTEPERSANDTRDAGGEVLEGTISDEMIQLDQLQSQGDPVVEAEEGDETGEGEEGPAPESDADPE